MDEATSNEVVQALFVLHTRGPSPSPADLGKHLDMLTTVVLDLMMEVEALREARAAGSDYRDAYRNTGLLMHDSTGPSMGWDKLLDRYYPRDKDLTGRVWRESLMLRRLGVSAGQIEAYRREAQGMEIRT